MCNRRGFTLLEVTIVLILLVGMMAIAWPRMSAAARRSDLPDAAMAVKNILAGVRDQSVRSGQPIHFIYENGSGQFRVGSSRSESSDRMSIGTVQQGDQDVELASKSGSLPADTVFFFEQDTDQEESSDFESVTFFPDGRSTQSEIHIALPDRTHSIQLSVRGLTGGVTIDPIERMTRQDAVPRNKER